MGKNKVILKNTIMLFIRMTVVLVVSLFTSRVVLNILAVEDFGIYNIVGGVVVMFSFFTNTLSSATSRFITFELGKNDMKRLKKVFSSSLFIHFLLAIFILILAETLGLWLVYNKLVIPGNRFSATIIVYQFSVFSSIVSILRIPYNSIIIAHEKMNVFAYISIIEVLLKLIIVYLLYIGNFDKLILYGILTFLVTLIISIIYVIYCLKNFDESKFNFTIDSKTVKPILLYSLWDLYGNFSIIIRGQGINILQNMFFGPIINAATGIANQVQNSVAGFSDNFLTAVRPQIVKNYASSQIKEMQLLIINSSKFSFLLLYFVSLPLIIENDFVLTLWLKNVPDYTIVFCQLSLINNLVSIMFRPIMFSIHATGNIKRISFINGTIYIFVLPISYIYLKNGYSPVVPFIINILLLCLGSIINLFTLKAYINTFSILLFSKKVIIPCFIIACLSLILPLYLYNSFEESWLRFLLIGITSSVCISLLTYIIGIDKLLKVKIKNKINIAINERFS